MEIRFGSWETEDPRQSTLEYWRTRTAQDRADCVRELVIAAWEMKGKKEDALRFDRTAFRIVETRS